MITTKMLKEVRKSSILLLTEVVKRMKIIRAKYGPQKETMY
jgi:hypothetical protein